METSQLEGSLSDDQFLQLALEASEARQAYQALAMMNTPTDVVEWAKARLQFERARVRMELADNCLYEATRILSQRHA
jgi:hypothetical protein